MTHADNKQIKVFEVSYAYIIPKTSVDQTVTNSFEDDEYEEPELIEEVKTQTKKSSKKYKSILAVETKRLLILISDFNRNSRKI
jgi:hypothetical protein